MAMIGMMGTGEMLPELQALLLPLLGLLLREPRGLRCTWRVSSFKWAIVGLWDFFAYPHTQSGCHVARTRSTQHSAADKARDPSVE